MKLSEIKLSQQGVLEGPLNEFAPPGDDGNDGFSEETLKMLAAQWWNGDQDPGVEKTLMAAGWEIGQDEGYDNGGVFVVQAGDINGHSYLSWPADELQGLAEGWKGALAGGIAGGMMGGPLGAAVGGLGGYVLGGGNPNTHLPDTPEEAYALGQQAARNGETEQDNPYEETMIGDDDELIAWHEGWESVHQASKRPKNPNWIEKPFVAETGSDAKYKVKTIGHDANGAYYLSPSTGKKVYKSGVQRGDHENPNTGEIKKQGAKEDSLNELSSDLLQRAAGIAKQKASKANNQWDNPLMKDVEKHYDTLSQKFSNKAVKVGQKDAVKKIASPAVMRKMGMAESGRVDSPVSQAIINRILKQRTDLLMKYGPEQVGNAIDNVADWVNIGPDDEIGFTDVSGWVNQVARYLQTQAGEGLEEADNANPVSRRDMIAALHKAHGWGTAELNLASDDELEAEYNKLQNSSTKTEEASPMIKPPSNRFDTKAEAFSYAKEHGGKVFKSTYTNPNTGIQQVSYVVKNSEVAEAKKGLYYYVNKRKKAGISRDKNDPRAPSEQDWKNAAKTAKKESTEYTRDPELYKARQKAQQHYTSVSPKDAFDKLTQRRLDHAEHDDKAQDNKIAELSAALSDIEAEMAKIKAANNPQPVPEAKAKVKTWADVLQEAEQRLKKNKITEGGNLGSHKDDGTPMPGWKGVAGKHQAQTIDLKVHNRGFIVPVLNNLLLAINNSFRISQGIELWSPKNLKSRKFLSGSSLHFFNTDINDDEFTKLKPKVGDIDTQINKEAEPQIAAWLNDSIGKVIGNGKLIGYSKGNEQFSSMWELTDPPMKVQIDLEFVDYTDKGEPTDWAGFSHSSSWEDLNQGIKGVFHKFIIQALAKLTTQEFLQRKLVGRGKARAEQDVPTTDSMLSFAVSSKEGGGLRPKYEPVLDAKGRPVVVDGMPVMQALPAAGYVKDIDQIFQSIFDKRINKATLKKVLPKTWSFVGILEIMNLVLNKEEKYQVLSAFIEKLFAPGAQGLYKGDPQRDLSEKNAALNYALKVLKVAPPENLEQIRQDYVQNYKVVSEDTTEKKTVEDTEPAVKSQLRKGMPHLRDLKPADFLDLIDELKTSGGRFKLQNIPLNVKVDGLGARFGKNAQGKPFMGTSRTEPRYTANFLDYHTEKGTTDSEILNRAANYDKLFNEMMVAIEVIDLKLGADFLKNKQVTCEVLYLPFASETADGKLKFVGIEYDKLPEGVDLVIVPYRITDGTTGQDIPNGDAVVQKIAKLGQQGNTMFMSNRLIQKGALDVTEIVNLLDNLEELKQIVSSTSGKRDRASLDLRKEVETKLKPVQLALEKAIDEDPKILGKTNLGLDYEGIVINSRLGPIKVTSQRQKDIIAAKNAARASQGAKSNKTAVVAIGSFVGHKGHQQLWDYTVKKAEQLGGDPYLFMGNAVGKDDPIPVADKIKTWHQMYPQYKNNIGAVTQEGGTLMQKIKHELINPTPGKPPRYDNIIIMVGEDQAKMPIAQALMKAVNKFAGYEHVKVSLEATPRGTGMSFTQLRNVLKQGTAKEQFNVWNNAFNDKQFGANPLPKSWIEHLMAASKQGMGLKEGKLKTLNQLIKEGLQAIQWKS